MSFKSHQRNLPFGLDYKDVSQQNNEKPEILLPVNGVSTDFEQRAALNFINFKNTINDGPFFTGLTIKEEINDGIKDGLKRYSDRYVKKRKHNPSINDHPYNIKFFPNELYKVMGINENKKLNLNLNKVDIFEKLKSFNDEDDSKVVEEEVEENDDEFEEEDDDDDYNAEKYFDDGEDFGDVDDYDDEAAF